jgi:3' exoribonuclease, RNase T-like
MSDVMIDIETLGTGPEALILTIAAQSFDPFTKGFQGYASYYARVTLESQPDRRIEDGTVAWWSKQPEHIREEAFSEHDRKPLQQCLEELGRMIWHSRHFWANGPTFDANILEHAYKSLGMPLPWQFYQVRDTRTVFSLWPDLPKPPATHNALEDCRRQIVMLQDCLDHFNIRTML